MTFSEFFSRAMDGRSPHPYQVRLSEADWPETLIIPTGFGKTAAIMASWLWKRGVRAESTPTRLIYCLPMRTLVEQTREVAGRWIEAASAKFNWTAAVKPDLHVLMGGESRPRGAPDWVMCVDRPTILVGTQDMLVSAALNRGYGSTRYRWPVDFALLHTDALWVFDEVQLTGAALPTSAQLQAWRRDNQLYPPAGGPFRPAGSLWMSATLDPAWLRTVDHTPRDLYRTNDLAPDDLASPHAATVWGAVKRLSEVAAPASLKTAKDQAAHANSIAALVRERVKPQTTVLVFLNTVARAQSVYELVTKAGVDDAVLIHSRFRPHERARLSERVTDKANPPPVIITTQALEAGVDLTSSVLITELAPWSSMVQRIGRCNRYGECGEAGAEVVWIDLPADGSPPYEETDLSEARAKLRGLEECGPRALSSIPPGDLADRPVIRRRDLLDLFDTEADLSGFDVDVSMYVRDSDDVDVQLFWRDIQASADAEGTNAASPRREELCAASLSGARELLSRKAVRAWRIDPLSRRKTAWVRLNAGDLRPGLQIMISSDGGGYLPRLGLAPQSAAAVVPVEAEAGTPVEPAPRLDDDLDTDVGSPVTLAAHSAHVRREAERLCDVLGIQGVLRGELLEAALWHDRGKAHAAFQQMLSATWREGDAILAKSARPPRPDRHADSGPQPYPDHRRRFFRHELASMLAYLAEKGWSRDADLCAYLIAAHHGKVRMRLRALPEEEPPETGGLFARGVHQGDLLPSAPLGNIWAPAVSLDLDIMQLGEGSHGASWSARTQALLKEYGPFQLAWLEAMIRIADWRASAAEEWAARDPAHRDPDTPWSPEKMGAAFP